MVRPGEQYRHFRGGLYEVIALARHSETLEELVVYRSVEHPEKVWARPLTMWAQTVEHNGEQVPRFALVAPPCQVLRSGRKTLSLQVLPDGSLRVRAPWNMPQSRIDAFLEQHRAWIDAHRQRALRRSAQLDAADPQALIRRAKEVLPGKVAFYAREMGVTPKGLRVTQAKTRFGSCGAGDTLNFSCYLMLQQEAQIDYVVVHELAHILHKDHSPAFYAEIARILPDYRQRERILRQ